MHSIGDEARDGAAARRARALERRLRGAGIGAIADAAQGAFVYVDREERIRFFSAGAEALYGMRRDDVVGRTVRETARVESYERYHPYVQAALAGRVVEYDRVLKRADGGERVLRARLVPHRGRDGGVRGYLGHFVDVTDLAAANAAATLSQQRFADFARASVDWFWESDAEGRLVWLSDSVERITGMPKAWFLGRQPQDLIDPSSPPDDGAWRQRALARERHEPYRDFRYRLRLPGGGLWISNSGVPYFDIGGAFAGYRGTTTDISAQVRLEEAQRASLRDLEAFSYSVSHDLRAPARAMNGFASIILEDHAGALPPEGIRLLRRIVEAGRNMGEMVDGLLALARVSRQAFGREPVDVSALAREVWAECEESAPCAGASLRVSDGLRAACDRVLLRSLLRNLIGNARKYARPGVPPAVAFDAAGGAFRVADNGIGFDMAHAGRLFVPFVRLHADACYEGSGIGLAIAHKVVERHGGRIWVRAAPERGAEFFFTLQPGATDGAPLS